MRGLKIHFANDCKSLSTIPDRNEANYQRGWYLAYLRPDSFKALAKYLRNKDPDKQFKWI